MRAAPAARIVNVGSGAGSLTLNADPAFPYRHMYSPGYAGSKTAMNAMTLSFAIQLENEGIRVNAVSPGFTSTNLNHFEGTESLEDGAREVVRVALLDDDTRSGTFTAWENAPIRGETCLFDFKIAVDLTSPLSSRVLRLHLLRHCVKFARPVGEGPAR